MYKCVLPPGDNPTAVNKYINVNINNSVYIYIYIYCGQKEQF